MTYAETVQVTATLMAQNKLNYLTKLVYCMWKLLTLWTQFEASK